MPPWPGWPADGGPLKTLRLAGLVQFSLRPDKEDRRYAARPGAVERAWETLRGFLGEDGSDGGEDER